MFNAKSTVSLLRWTFFLPQFESQKQEVTTHPFNKPHAGKPQYVWMRITLTPMSHWASKRQRSSQIFQPVLHNRQPT